MEAATATDERAEERTDEEELDDEIVIDGDVPQLTLNVGGRKPTVSAIVLQGGEFKLAGQFEKGTRLRFLAEGTVDEIATRDHRDRKSGTVTAVKRTHKLTVENVEKL